MNTGMLWTGKATFYNLKTFLSSWIFSICPSRSTPPSFLPCSVTEEATLLRLHLLAPWSLGFTWVIQWNGHQETKGRKERKAGAFIPQFLLLQSSPESPQLPSGSTSLQLNHLQVTRDSLCPCLLRTKERQWLSIVNSRMLGQFLLISLTSA